MGLLKAIDTVLRKAKPVTSTNRRLNTNALTTTEEITRALAGDLYTWTVDYSAGSGHNALYLRNSSTSQQLFIRAVDVNSKIKTAFRLFFSDGTGSGTPVTGVNWGPTISGTADAVAFQAAADVGTLLKIGCVRVPAWSHDDFPIDSALVLDEDQAIVVVNEATSEICVTIRGFYK